MGLVSLSDQPREDCPECFVLLLYLVALGFVHQATYYGLPISYPEPDFCLKLELDFTLRRNQATCNGLLSSLTSPDHQMEWYNFLRES